MNSNTGWKWATLILAVLLLMLLACCMGTVFGSMLGFRLAARFGPSVYHLPVMPNMPESPAYPAPELWPDEPPAAARPWLGLAFRMGDEGALVALVVPGSPAEAAGLRVGDIIIEVDGQRVTVAHPLDEHLQAYAPGDRVQLIVMREGRVREIEVRLEMQPRELPRAPGGDG